MKKTTTTRATHRGVEITVMSDRIGTSTMYSCTNSRSKQNGQDTWFPTQGEAIANERHEIDRILG
jgi:hypothetical protein